jgi:nucleoid DNA-binding protein
VVGMALADSERVVFSGMGVFTIHVSKKRFRSHPVTKEPYLSKPTRRVKFRPSKSFRSESCG